MTTLLQRLLQDLQQQPPSLPMCAVAVIGQSMTTSASQLMIPMEAWVAMPAVLRKSADFADLTFSLLANSVDFE